MERGCECEGTNMVSYMTDPFFGPSKRGLQDEMDVRPWECVPVNDLHMMEGGISETAWKKPECTRIAACRLRALGQSLSLGLPA